MGEIKLGEDRVVVAFGSVHTDLIATVPRLPGWGETIHGTAFTVGLGGKAGNQAIGAARAGARTFILGRIGDDRFGEALRAMLTEAGVDCLHLSVDPAEPTGASTVFTGPDGDYASAIVPGASAALTAADIEDATALLVETAVFIGQLEIPAQATILAARAVQNAGGCVVLNASPLSAALDCPAELLLATDVVVVNRLEAAILARVDVDAILPRALPSAVRSSLDVPAVVVTLGRDGAVATDDAGTFAVEGLDVTVVDTVGAGDAFAGALAAELARGAALPEALPFANAAGALAVGRRGSASSLPTRAEILAFVATASRQPR